MKQINSILRTLCLMALLCMTSVSASAYKVYNGDPVYLSDKSFFVSFMSTDKILVIGGEKSEIYLDNLKIPSGYSVIIEPNKFLSVNSTFINEGSLYVFGILYIPHNAQNFGFFYTAIESMILGEIENFGRIYNSVPYSSRMVTDSEFPVTTYRGWNNHWEQGIADSDDFYPMGDYEDEACTKPITDLEAWKAAHSNIDLGLKIGGTTYDQWKYYDTDEKKGFFYDGDLTFTDKDIYQCDYDFTVDGNLEYNRTFKATGVWQAWFVPFDVTVYDMNAAGMEVAEIAGVLMDEKEPYIAFAKMTNTDAIVKANTPYVVKTTKSSVSMTLTGPDICIRKSTDAELEAQRLTVQSSYNTFTFGGNYQPTNGYANEWYALNTSGVFQKMGDGAKLAPQRFWMTIDTRTDTPYHTGSSATAKAFINFTVLGDDDTTGIESLTPSLSKGKGTIYNLQGQKVTSIRKGQVYIVDGKRFMAR